MSNLILFGLVIASYTACVLCEDCPTFNVCTNVFECTNRVQAFALLKDGTECPACTVCSDYWSDVPESECPQFVCPFRMMPSHSCEIYSQFIYRDSGTKVCNACDAITCSQWK